MYTVISYVYFIYRNQLDYATVLKTRPLGSHKMHWHISSDFLSIFWWNSLLFAAFLWIFVLSFLYLEFMCLTLASYGLLLWIMYVHCYSSFSEEIDQYYHGAKTLKKSIWVKPGMHWIELVKGMYWNGWVKLIILRVFFCRVGQRESPCIDMVRHVPREFSNSIAHQPIGCPANHT